MHVVVIGAGIVGVAAAIRLRRDGHGVTLVDREGPAAGASFGNGAVLARLACVPVTVPGLLGKAPGMLLDPGSPLFVRWSKLAPLVPWLARYLSHANRRDTERIARALAPMVRDSVDQHRALAGNGAAARFIAPSPYAYVYRDRAAFDADAYAWGLRAEAGFVPEIVEGAAVREREPILGPDAGLLAIAADHGSIRDPGAYVHALADMFAQAGGTIRRAAVTGVSLRNGRAAAVETEGGPIPCDRAVVAAGAWSAKLLRPLGLRVPLAAERGYHVTYHDPDRRPTMPLMLADAKFVATPVDDGIRCAGIVEFGGTDDAKSPAALRLMRRRVTETFPGLTARRQSEWMGLRPSPADSLPVVGEVGRTGVFAAFGHHHVGLTAGPRTGRMVADMIAGRPPDVDIAPYDPQRFA